MFLLKTAQVTTDFLDKQREKNKTIGFVPTLGALHEGHMSLIEIAKEKADFVVVSIFVNPTQFNNEDDLKKYPRTIDSDMRMLFEHGVNLLFLPDQQEIYPNGTEYTDRVDLEGLDMILEGEHRPGHFDGVVQVVRRLLEIIKPDVLVMGQKDYQQLAIIRKMLKELHWDDKIDLIGASTMREEHGLARSSRNERLSSDIRKEASLIHQTLQEVKKEYDPDKIDELKKEALDKLSREPFRPEYFEIIDGHDLHPLKNGENADSVVAVTAVWAGDVRLIDNIVIK